MSVPGLNSKDRKSTRDKANISNPKVNRGCAPLTANRISADCVQISLGPSIPYIPLGVYHTGGFNAMATHTSRSEMYTDPSISSIDIPRINGNLQNATGYDTVFHNRLNIHNLSKCTSIQNVSDPSLTECAILGPGKQKKNDIKNTNPQWTFMCVILVPFSTTIGE